MQVTVLAETGHEIALQGMAYSYKDRELTPAQWWTEDRYSKAQSRAALLASKHASHAKFLRQIVLWLDIEAPRCWWSEMDTYEFTVAQSESTMHTLSKRPPCLDDFEPETAEATVTNFIMQWYLSHDITKLKANLPEGFKQRRIVTLNYAVLRQIYAMRQNHRLKYWQTFCEDLYKQLQHPEYLADLMRIP